MNPASFALAEFNRLQATAQRAVSAGQTTADRATRKLRAWLSIACLLGADHPEIARRLAGFAVQFGDLPGEASRRLVVADDLAPRADRLRALSGARDKELGQPTTAESVGRLTALRAIAVALRVVVPAWKETPSPAGMAAKRTLAQATNKELAA